MFRALRLDEPTADSGDVDLIPDLTNDALMPGDVVVDVSHSSVNYKDAMALTGRPGVVRHYPIIPGIDLVGTVRTSTDPRWSVGDQVLANGWGLGEKHHGGLAERARLDGDWLTHLPDGMEPRHAAAIGTAGFTAMLAFMALERAGLPTGDDTVLVTGATGGVGSVALMLLQKYGVRTAAVTGRVGELGSELRRLGADRIIERDELTELPRSPLQTSRWAGAIDTIGGPTLANVLAQTQYGGTVAACGLAASTDLPVTVLPFILRGISLVGINSVYAPTPVREEAWQRLAADIDRDTLDSVTTTIGLGEVWSVAQRIMENVAHGRIVVDVRR